MPLTITPESYPAVTWAGTKFRPTIDAGFRTGCDSCPHYQACRYDVLYRDGFAWCEEIIPVDLDLDYSTVSRDTLRRIA